MKNKVLKPSNQGLKIRPLSLTALIICASVLLTACSAYKYPSVPVACETQSDALRDYRDAPSDNITEQAAGKMLFDNSYDRFPKDIITVCNSDFTVSDALCAEIYECVSKYKFVTGFYLIDAETKMSCGYNADEPFYTASTIKAGYALYCFKCIAEGKASMTDTMKYQAKHKIGGSGSTQNSSYGTSFTIETLLFRVLFNSDNVAYYMLLDYFGMEGYNEMVKSLGISHYLTPEERWGYLSPHELGLIWQEIYRFRNTCAEGAKLWESLTSNLYNELADELTEYTVIAHKSGWGRPAFHDAGVVCGEHPYIIVVMTDTESKNNCLYELIRKCDSIMLEYAAWCTAAEE